MAELVNNGYALVRIVASDDYLAREAVTREIERRKAKEAQENLGALLAIDAEKSRKIAYYKRRMREMEKALQPDRLEDFYTVLGIAQLIVTFPIKKGVNAVRRIYWRARRCY